MIRPLRQRHRHIVMVLGVFLPIVFAAGITARKSVPTMITLPKELFSSPQAFANTEWERTDLFANPPMQVRLLRERASAGRFAVEFFAAKNFVKPDLLVYWVAGNTNITNRLPDDALLLGVFDSSAALQLPSNITADSGVLVHYSLADQMVIEVSKPITLSKQ